MNATSSRAHTVVTIVFSQISKNEAGQETKKTSVINLVDLAGKIFTLHVEGLVQWLRSLPPNPEVPGLIPAWLRVDIWVTFFPTKVHSAFHPFRVGKINTSIHVH